MADEIILKGKEAEEYEAARVARENSAADVAMKEEIARQLKELELGKKVVTKEAKEIYSEQAGKHAELSFDRKARALQRQILGMIYRNKDQFLSGFTELGGDEGMIVRSGETQNEGTAADGLNAVAPAFMLDVMAKTMKDSILYQKANVIPVTTLTAYHTPLLTGISVADSTETGTPANTRVSLDQFNISVKDTRASTVFSNNLLADAPQLYNFVVRMYGEALKTKHNQILFTDSTGSSKNFNGMLAETVTGSGFGLTGVTTGGAKVYFLSGGTDSVTNADLNAVVHSLSEEDWPNAEWYFNDGFSTDLENLVGQDQRPLLFAANDGVATRLKGHNIQRCRVMPYTSLTAGQPFAAFGDLKSTCHFWDRQDATFAVIREGTVNGVACGEQGATGLVMFKRHAFKVYVNRFNDAVRTGLTLIARS